MHVLQAGGQQRGCAAPCIAAGLAPRPGGDEFICSLNLLPLGAHLTVNQFGAFGPGLMQVPMEHA